MDEHAMRRCIEHKRHGAELTNDEWTGIIAGFMNGEVDEAQMSALCMACVWRGLSVEETFSLTRAMVESGGTIRFDGSEGVVVDKHSSGGVSDIVSLIAVPLAAACGARVAKLAGRSLGHTGGTIDKLEAIPGVTTDLHIDRFVRQVRRIGCAIAAQSDGIVPADKRLYHLRDRTSTVPALGLVASSILCKKIAGGADAFVFDVKSGAASFMREPERARELADRLIKLSGRFGRRASAFVSDMNQPLGRNIGAGLEAIEARELLRGNADERPRELVVAVATAMVEHAGILGAAERVKEALSDGRAYEKFLELIAAQGGDIRAFEAMRPPRALTLRAPHAGFVRGIDVVGLGHAARVLASRHRLGGLRVEVRIGDRVDVGAPLLQLYGADERARARMVRAFALGDEPVAAPPVVYERI